MSETSPMSRLRILMEIRVARMIEGKLVAAAFQSDDASRDIEVYAVFAMDIRFPYSISVYTAMEIVSWIYPSPWPRQPGACSVFFPLLCHVPSPRGRNCCILLSVHIAY